MTYSDTQPRGTLRYRLLSASLLPSSSTLTEPGLWGHEYVRHLAAELGEEYTFRMDEEGVEPPAPTPDAPSDDAEPPPAKPVEVIGSIEDLRAIAIQCATFLLAHNAEPDAVDLLEELEMVQRITELVDKDTYVRVTQYMVRYVAVTNLTGICI
jgi:26S proteasome regulatory subunit N1